MKQRKKSVLILGNLCLLLASSILSLLLLEMAYRFVLFGWSSLSIHKMNSLHGIGASGLVRTSAHREIVFELKPDLKTYFKLTPFETNSHGLRDQEYPLAKPPGTFRITVVGDSFTMPSGVTIEDAFHSRLERRLNRERGGGRFEVINFGASGYGLREYAAIIEHRCLRYDPDLILVGFCARNDHKPSKWTYDHSYAPKPVAHPFFSKSFVLDGFKLAKEIRRKKVKSKTPRRRIKTEKHRQYLSRYLGKIGDLSRRSSVPVVVVLLDIGVVRSRFLEKILPSHQIHFLNATLAFKDRPYGDYMVSPLDSHPNGAANEIFADEIFAFLDEKNLVGTRGDGDR